MDVNMQETDRGFDHPSVRRKKEQGKRAVKRFMSIILGVGAGVREPK